ncbi:MAG: S-layer family protein, partial [Fischerella sp.]|nr:S-layer family protein [Fischerella sp.]
ISRVTGSSVSNIDGLIRANGIANLFLINPNGIIFGQNARLDIGGSFVASTASSLKFADGFEFSAAAPQSAPLLTISVPVGLQFGQNPAAINVRGTGHNFTVASPIFSPVTRNSSSTGLRVQPGQTLALVGGNLSLEGGTLTAEGGRIELGSVAGGLVSLNPTVGGWSLGYEGVAAFGELKLSEKALADASGISAGSIQVQAGNLSVEDGSLVLIQNQGSQAAGAIKVNASESVKVSGTNSDGTIRSSLTNETVAAGGGGDVDVSTRQLVVETGATIVAKTFSPATGGNVNINAFDSLQVNGASTVNPSVTSSIVAATFGPGNSGNHTVSTGRLSATRGGTVASASFGTGKAGNLSVNATDSVEIVGVEPNLFAPSGLLASTFNTGNGGNLTVNTPRLTIRDGGRVDASAFASGAAGNVTINVPEFVEVKGTVPGSVNPSLIVSSANLVDKSLQQLFGLPPLPSGSSGDVTINTGQLKITDGALVSTRSDGSGTSGNVRINARSIFLDNKSGITSELGGTIAAGQISVFSPVTIRGGKGGDIAISTQQLAVKGGSSISTATFTNAPGGNVTIDASDSVEVSGAGPFQSPVSFLGVSTFNTGDVGDITINTGKLRIRDGGRIDSLTTTSGSTGSITINASKSVEVSGKLPGTSIPSLISAGANIENEFARQIFGLPPAPTGASGDVTIDTDQLIIKDGALVTVSNQGAGDAGNLKVTSGSIRLDNQGKLTANSAAGTEGNILLKVPDLLLLRRNSEISAVSGTVKTGGSGGNFIADVGVIVAVPSENSDIITNAFTGRGGNITIRSDGIFGTQFQQQQTSESDIVASGRVKFTTPNVDPSSGLIELPTNVVDPTQQISTACTPGSPQRRSSFVVTGRGGLPLSATDLLQDAGTLAEWVRTRGKPAQAQMQLQPTKVATGSAPIVEASGWMVDANGDIQLVAQAPAATPHSQWLLSASCPIR